MIVGTLVLYFLAGTTVIWLETHGKGVWIETSPIYQFVKSNFAKEYGPYGVVFLLGIFTFSISSLVAGALKASMPGGFDNDNPREQSTKAKGIAARAVAAHTNAVETFPLMVAAIMAARATKVPLSLQMHFSVLHLSLRLLQWFAYLANLSTLRSFSWISCIVCCYLLFAFALLPGFEGTYYNLTIRSAMFFNNLSHPWKMLGL